MKVDKTKLPQADPNQQLKDKLRGAAQLYEQQFLGEMVKAMRNSVSHSSMTKPGMAENIYQEQLDSQYVESWVDRGGTGFADLIYQQMVDRYFPQLQESSSQSPQVRPVNLSDRFQGATQMPSEKPETLSYQISLKPESKHQDSRLNIPWQAKFAQAFSLPSGEQVAKLEHSNGLNSTLVFQGQLDQSKMGQTLEQGVSIGRLSPKAQALNWEISEASSRKDPSLKENPTFP